ncbi:MAG: hypothetical protein AB1330_01500 [Bacillota bacterium]
MRSCSNCRYLVYIRDFGSESPAPPTRVYRVGDILVRQGLRYHPVYVPYYCRIKLARSLDRLGLDSNLPVERLYQFVEPEQIADAQVARSLERRLNDSYTRHRRDKVYFTELNFRMEQVGSVRPWAQSRARLIEEALREEGEYCGEYTPRVSYYSG